MNLPNQTKEWLTNQYPRLTPNQVGVSGVIGFTATYNKDTNRFLVLREGVADSVGGLRLSGEFNIRIEDRSDTTQSKLPALYVEDVETIPDRHFGQKDFSACLCSPLDERKFLTPHFDFRLYFEELVIPFLYGQLFYTQNQVWPWSEYSHGGIGLLESYFDFKDNTSKGSIPDFINVLKLDNQWANYERLLAVTRPSKQSCPCASGYIFRDCHPKALKGFIQLKKDIHA